MRRILFFAVALVIPFSASSEQTSRSDPAATGPYAIGHTSFLVVDTTRRVEGDSNWGGRPIPVNVWYPVDASDITSETPDGVYRLDPLYAGSAWNVPTAASRWQHPCDSLPNPALAPLCQTAKVIESPPVYEGVRVSADGPFPLVLFSPGWSNRVFTYSFFAGQLASHGLVVALAQHYRDRYVSWDPLDPFYVAMFNRPRDLSFMLDALLAMNEDMRDSPGIYLGPPMSGFPSDRYSTRAASMTGKLLYNSMRPDLVAAVGHSIGGYAALTLAGGDDEVCVGTTHDTNPLPSDCTPIKDQYLNPVVTFPDPRVRAIVTLDASNPVLHFNELARITVPSMSIGEAVDAPGWSVFFPARQHAAISGHPNYRVDVRNALHQSFTNSCTGVWVSYGNGFTDEKTLMLQVNQPWCTTALQQAAVNQLMAKYAIAFLKTHLVGEKGYQHMLTPGWTRTREPNIEFFVTEPGNATSLGEDPTTFRYFLHHGILSEPTEKDPE